MTRYLNLVKNVSNWWLHFALKLGVIKSDPLVFRLKNNTIVAAPRRLLHEFKEIFMEECYTYKLKGLPVKPRIIDIGANVGFFAIFAASTFPEATIYAYEPIAVNFEQLRHNQKLNPQANIQCFKIAVCSHTGDVALTFDPNDSFTTAASILKNPGTGHITQHVPCTSLFDIFKSHRLDACELIKIDCEGAEYDILYSCPEAVLRRIDQMVIEVHEGNAPHQNIGSLSKHLNRSGFETEQIGHMLWANRLDAN